jgi:hypothetical protein
MFSGLLLAATSVEAASRTDVSVGLRRLAGGDVSEVRIRSSAGGTEWLVDVRRRGSFRDEARLGVAFPWAGGMLRAGNLREAVPSPGRRSADPLDPPRVSPAPSLGAVGGAKGIAWTREGIRRGISFALSRGPLGEAVPAVRTRWNRIETALAGGSRPVGALAWSLAGEGVRGRAECRVEDGTREANLALVADRAGLAFSVLRERSLPWSAQVRGGIAVRGGPLRGLAFRVRAGNPPGRSRETWEASWRPLDTGVSGEIGEVRGRVRWNARAARAARAGWIVEGGVASGALRPGELSAELRRVRGDLRGGARLHLAADRARRGSAWLTRDLGGDTRLRVAAAWERERRATVEIALTRQLRGSP